MLIPDTNLYGICAFDLRIHANCWQPTVQFLLGGVFWPRSPYHCLSDTCQRTRWWWARTTRWSTTSTTGWGSFSRYWHKLGFKLSSVKQIHLPTSDYFPTPPRIPAPSLASSRLLTSTWMSFLATVRSSGKLTPIHFFTEITVDFCDFMTSNPPQKAEAKVSEICREGGEEGAWPGAPQRGKHCLDDCGGASAQWGGCAQGAPGNVNQLSPKIFLAYAIYVFIENFSMNKFMDL